MVLHSLNRLYQSLLRLYPRNFQADYAAEMYEVFALAAREARCQGAFALGRLCLKELASLPASLWRAYFTPPAARMAPARHPAASARLDQPWQELLLVLLVFLLPAVMLLVHQEPHDSAAIGVPAAGLFVFVMIAIGWLGGLPLWSLPYTGLILVVAGYLYLFQWVAGLVRPALIANFASGPWDRSTYLLLEVFSTGMLWLMLFSLTLLIVALLAVFNRFQPLWAHVRHDWTLLSYILYGESFFALALLFETHRFDPRFAIAGLLCLAAGIWLFQRSPTGGQRLLALVSCLTLAVGFAALAKTPSAPSSAWSPWAGLSIGEAGRLLLSWIWMVAAVLLPALLARLAPKPPHTHLPGSPRGGQTP